MWRDLEHLKKESLFFIGSETFGLLGKQQLISSAGIVVENDMVLKLLVNKGQSRFSLRDAEPTADFVEAAIPPAPPADSSEQSQTNADDNEASQQVDENDHSSTSSASSSVYLNTFRNRLNILFTLTFFFKDMFYPVLDILRQMKQGKRVKLTATEVIQKLLALDMDEWTIDDRKQIHKAVGPWLMGQAKYDLFLKLFTAS